jgi:hypothetical protein
MAYLFLTGSPRVSLEDKRISLMVVGLLLNSISDPPRCTGNYWRAAITLFKLGLLIHKAASMPENNSLFNQYILNRERKHRYLMVTNHEFRYYHLVNIGNKQPIQTENETCREGGFVQHWPCAGWHPAHSRQRLPAKRLHCGLA